MLKIFLCRKLAPKIKERFWFTSFIVYIFGFNTLCLANILIIINLKKGAHKELNKSKATSPCSCKMGDVFLTDIDKN